MSGNTTSFFDEKIEDEAIALSDSELDNILGGETLDAEVIAETPSFNDSGIIREEPDVIIVEKKDLSAPSSDINDGMLPAEALLDNEMPAEELAAEPLDEVEPEKPEQIPSDSVEEIPAMTAVDGEETLLAAEELSLEELTAEQPSEVEALEALPDLPPAEELAAEEPMELESTELPQEAALEEIPLEAAEETPSEPATGIAENLMAEPELIAETAPESVDEVNLDSAEIPSADELPSLEMGPQITTQSEPEMEEVTLAETPAFEEVEPVELPENTDLKQVDEIVLEDSSSTPEEVAVTDEPVPTIELEEESPHTSEPLAMGEPQKVDFNEPDPHAAQRREPVEEVTEEVSLFSGKEAPKQKVEENSSFFDEADEDESITLSSDELSNILTDAEVEEKEGVTPEPSQIPTSMPATEATASGIEEALQFVEGSAFSRESLKDLLVYIDNLLDKLPEEEIQKFARSKYYDLYNRLFEELGIV
jgi:hypothetical protein